MRLISFICLVVAALCIGYSTNAKADFERRDTYQPDYYSVPSAYNQPSCRYEIRYDQYGNPYTVQICSGS